MMCGGPSEPKEMTDEVRDITIALKGAAEQKHGKTYNTFEPVSFTSQVVAGTVFMVKVKVDNDEHVELKIFKPLPHTGDPCELMDQWLYSY